LLRERSAVHGISLPGMPQGSPGMSARKRAAFRIHAINAAGMAQARVYALA